MAYFRHKQKFDEHDATIKTPYGHEYFVFDGFLFIPDIQKLDIQYVQKVNYCLKNHIEVPDEIKKRFLETYPKFSSELYITKKVKNESAVS